MRNSTPTILFKFLTLLGVSRADDFATANGQGLHSDNGQQLGTNSMPPDGNIIILKGMKCSCSSFDEGNRCGSAVDGDLSTFWCSKSGPGANPLPHNITVDFKTVRILTGMALAPPPKDTNKGSVYMHEILCDGKLIAYGTWAVDVVWKFSNFEPVGCRTVTVVHKKGADDRQETCIAELKFFESKLSDKVDTRLGKWGHTIHLPIVAVACAQRPDGRFMAWSAWGYDRFTNGPGGITKTCTVDLVAQTVTERTVTETGHDMFCPGASIDSQGTVMVTGGNDAKKASKYNINDDTWTPAPNMLIPRGYTASTTCSNDKTFVLGGSWNGGVDGKNGELYDPGTNQWTKLPGCRADAMLTGDKDGVYRADNHGWLFGWKNNTVFHAGPSKNMNWYSIDGDGGVQGAGARGDDNDAMCGNAVMFDAVAGKLFTCGGSEDYVDSPASTNAYCITIKEPNSIANVQPTANKMASARIYHNSVILPNGKVFIVGGQETGAQFTDKGSVRTPEIWDPADNSIRKLTPHQIPRNYHSIALLTMNATVLSAGGGLCGACEANHLDMQIYWPYYLWDKNGKEARRPVILSISTNKMSPGSKFTVKTDVNCKNFSLMRLSACTHAVNNDQRRVPLEPKQQQQRAGKPFTYTCVLPADPGVCPGGYYWLFVHNDQGVPSAAKTIQVVLQK
nr:PREDICTED: galactose oxidase-like [Bemisia tabaci]